MPAIQRMYMYGTVWTIEVHILMYKKSAAVNLLMDFIYIIGFFYEYKPPTRDRIDEIVLTFKICLN